MPSQAVEKTENSSNINSKQPTMNELGPSLVVLLRRKNDIRKPNVTLIKDHPL
ncbi:hypothetical protein FD12_GL000432 [Lentilactobacillus rapi DSM 19907 = JCM 15042]|uniref:Uncharacterized protein n=1 Tax=Lentilactobacillus rapi DSM 19907 = JCM 15042 TaxID=1423795 RepID=A0ABR5PBJ9_9LACO|nr:hypothetical protein FD12_GL000432 [Lentilactobacillus rapi DSM 19907 = JCM 15042]